MKENKQKISDTQIGEWLENALKAETIVTKAAFDLAGYEACLMRHSRKPEIDMFISGINIEMAKRRKEGKFSVRDEDYFGRMMENLEESVRAIATKQKFSAKCPKENCGFSQ